MILSFLYRTTVTIRNFFYDCKLLKTYRPSIPVISVGNLTAGGGGKTPMVIEIFEILKKSNYRPVILSRGYKGQLVGPVLVNDMHSPKEVGDEPYLIHQRGFSVVVAKKKVRGAKFIVEKDIGDVIIVDDGFQHRALARDLDLLLIDVSTRSAIELFVTGKLLPWGRLREDKKGINRASAIVLSHKNNLNVDLPSYFIDNLPKKPIFNSFYKESKLPYKDSKEGHEEPVVLFCGISNPESFFNSVEIKGHRIIHKETFPDHYTYTEEDILKLKSKFPDVKLVCTEKDYVKIPDSLRSGVIFLKIELVIKEREEFNRMILQTVSSTTHRHVFHSGTE